MLGSTVVTCSASAPGCFWKNLQLFIREGVHSAPEVDSRLLSTFEVTALDVDNGSGMFCSGFAGLNARRAVSDDCRQSEGEKGAQSMLQLLSLSHGNLHIISRSLLHLADIFSSLEVARVDFLGALDDEEFFVVKGSGWRCRGSLDSQVTCHQ